MTKTLMIDLSVSDIINLLNRNEANPPPTHLDASKATMEFSPASSEDTEDTVTIMVEI